MRAKASAHSLVWVANLQIPARGGNRSSTLLQGVGEMGLQFICSQIQLLSSGPHQMGPNLHWECCNDIMPALAAATAGRMRVCVDVCASVSGLAEGRGWWRRRKRQMTLSAQDSWLNCSPEMQKREMVPLISLRNWMMLMQTARLMSRRLCSPAPERPALC